MVINQHTVGALIFLCIIVQASGNNCTVATVTGTISERIVTIDDAEATFTEDVLFLRSNPCELAPCPSPTGVCPPCNYALLNASCGATPSPNPLNCQCSDKADLCTQSAPARASNNTENRVIGYPWMPLEIGQRYGPFKISLGSHQFFRFFMPTECDAYRVHLEAVIGNPDLAVYNFPFGFEVAPSIIIPGPVFTRNGNSRNQGSDIVTRCPVGRLGNGTRYIQVTGNSSAVYQIWVEQVVLKRVSATPTPAPALPGYTGLTVLTLGKRSLYDLGAKPNYNPSNPNASMSYFYAYQTGACPHIFSVSMAHVIGNFSVAVSTRTDQRYPSPDDRDHLDATGTVAILEQGGHQSVTLSTCQGSQSILFMGVQKFYSDGRGRALVQLLVHDARTNGDLVGLDHLGGDQSTRDALVSSTFVQCPGQRFMYCNGKTSSRCGASLGYRPQTPKASGMIIPSEQVLGTPLTASDRLPMSNRSVRVSMIRNVHHFAQNVSVMDIFPGLEACTLHFNDLFYRNRTPIGSITIGRENLSCKDATLLAESVRSSLVAMGSSVNETVRSELAMNLSLTMLRRPLSTCQMLSRSFFVEVQRNITRLSRRCASVGSARDVDPCCNHMAQWTGACIPTMRTMSSTTLVSLNTSAVSNRCARSGCVEAFLKDYQTHQAVSEDQNECRNKQDKKLYLFDQAAPWRNCTLRVFGPAFKGSTCATDTECTRLFGAGSLCTTGYCNHTLTMQHLAFTQCLVSDMPVELQQIWISKYALSGTPKSSTLAQSLYDMFSKRANGSDYTVCATKNGFTPFPRNPFLGTEYDAVLRRSTDSPLCYLPDKIFENMGYVYAPLEEWHFGCDQESQYARIPVKPIRCGAPSCNIGSQSSNCTGDFCVYDKSSKGGHYANTHIRTMNDCKTMGQVCVFGNFTTASLSPAQCAQAGSCSIPCEVKGVQVPCTNQTMCEAATQCSDRSVLHDTGTCVAPLTRFDTLPCTHRWPSARPLPFSHPVGCILGHLNSSVACKAAGYTWMTPAGHSNVSACQNQAWLCKEGKSLSGRHRTHFWTPKNASTCSESGGVYSPLFESVSGIWTPGVIRNVSWVTARKVNPFSMQKGMNLEELGKAVEQSIYDRYATIHEIPSLSCATRFDRVNARVLDCSCRDQQTGACISSLPIPSSSTAPCSFISSSPSITPSPSGSPDADVPVSGAASHTDILYLLVVCVGIILA